MFTIHRRLKQNIGLPKIHCRPPCPPNVYEKLYRQFDSALNTGARRSSRSTKYLEPIKSTKASSSTRRTSVKTSASIPYSAGRERKRELPISKQEPSWVMKAIRGLCRQLGAPAAPPHVFAGVSSILTTSPPYQQSMTDDDLERLRSLTVESLIVAVYMLVRTRLSGVETDPSTFSEQRDTALTVLIQVRNGEETSTAIDPTSVIDWMQEIRRGRWTELDWFSNITVGAGLGLDEAESTHPIDSDRGDSDDDEPLAHGKRAARGYGAEKPYLQPGLNTMVCR